MFQWVSKISKDCASTVSNVAQQSAREVSNIGDNCVSTVSNFAQRSAQIIADGTTDTVASVGQEVGAINTMMSPSRMDPEGYTIRSNWMSGLSDSTLLSAMTIPGTHQTMARHGLGGVCQERTLTEQYDMGVRFVDIRCRWFGDTLPLHHGQWFQQGYFTGDVVRPTVQFLRDHPRETVLMLVKDENHQTVKGGHSFSMLVQYSFNDAGASVLHNVPKTLGKARGRIILFYKDWPDNDCRLGTSLFRHFSVHDDYNQHDGDRRWQGARDHLDKATMRSREDSFLTYVSGYKKAIAINDTYGMANHLNPKLRDYIKSHRSHRLGVVLSDFVLDDIVGDLIQCNNWHLKRQEISWELVDYFEWRHPILKERDTAFHIYPD